jgi:hypothetical protein
MSPKHQARLNAIRAGRIQRAKELIAHLDLLGIEIGWEKEYTTFKPATGCPQRLMEEATLLSQEIKAIKEGRAS